uniref:(northern house mosquito) hypothetical protein n=1 Tax=Culex pipiens TaxID=7175 RepID=A0A8D8G9D3_CULPI
MVATAVSGSWLGVKLIVWGSCLDFLRRLPRRLGGSSSPSSIALIQVIGVGLPWRSSLSDSAPSPPRTRSSTVSGIWLWCCIHEGSCSWLGDSSDDAFQYNVSWL